MDQRRLLVKLWNVRVGAGVRLSGYLLHACTKRGAALYRVPSSDYYSRPRIALAVR